MFERPEQKQHSIVFERLPHLLFPGAKKLTPIEKIWSVITFFLGTLSLFFVIVMADSPVHRFISPVFHSIAMLQPWFHHEQPHKKFAFAPGGSERKLDLIDFHGLNTLAYFDLPVNADGTIDKDTDAYQTLKSDTGVALFDTAHQHGTNVFLTLTQTSSTYISSFLNDPAAQREVTSEAIQEVKDTGANGVVLDFEYAGEAGQTYKAAYTQFVSDFTNTLHREIPSAQVAVAVSPAANNQGLYDVQSLSDTVDQVFVMAYTFAVPEEKDDAASAPAYGYNNENYWKDVDTTVQEYSKQISSDKFVIRQAQKYKPDYR